MKFDSGYNDDERFGVFSSNFCLFYLKKASIFMIDGTFKSSPLGFYQLISIHAQMFSETFPLMFILFKLKRKLGYHRALSKNL